MSMTNEELNKLKEEFNSVNEKLHELTPEELAQVSGGAVPYERTRRPVIEPADPEPVIIEPVIIEPADPEPVIIEHVIIEPADPKHAIDKHAIAKPVAARAMSTPLK